MRKFLAYGAHVQLPLRLEIAALALIVGIQVVVMFTRTEYFPWSPFPMYAGYISSTPFYGLQVYLAGANGHEMRLENVLTPRPKYELSDRFNIKSLYLAPLTDDERAKFQLFSKIFTHDLNEEGLESHFREIRYYVQYWKKFDGQRRKNPDIRKLVYEQNL